MDTKLKMGLAKRELGQSYAPIWAGVQEKGTRQSSSSENDFREHRNYNEEIYEWYLKMLDIRVKWLKRKFGLRPDGGSRGIIFWRNTVSITKYKSEGNYGWAKIGDFLIASVTWGNTKGPKGAPERRRLGASKTTLRDNDSPPHQSSGGRGGGGSKLKEGPRGPIFEIRECAQERNKGGGAECALYHYGVS